MSLVESKKMVSWLKLLRITKAESTTTALLLLLLLSSGISSYGDEDSYGSLSQVNSASSRVSESGKNDKADLATEKKDRVENTSPADIEKKVEALHTEALELSSSKNYDRAIAVMTQAMNLDPGNTKLLRDRASFYYLQGQYDKALADSNRVVEMTPKHAGSVGGRGLIQYARRDYKAAIEDYNRAITLRPSLAGLLTPDLAMAYAKDGNLQEAIRRIRYCERAFPSIDSYLVHAQILEESGNIPGAKKVLEQCLQSWKEKGYDSDEELQKVVDRLKRLG